jgi:molybdate transport system substrate-binding protein
LSEEKTMASGTAMPVELRVLSAGAIEPGLVATAAAFGREQGTRVDINWATTPTIRARIAAGETFDLLIVPTDALDELAAAGKLVPAERVILGRVGVGVAVRTGAPVPAIGDTAALQRALDEAEAIVFTRATSGTYVESMLRRLGWYQRLLARITRFVTGPEMMDHLIHGHGREVCLGAIVELMMFRDQGVHYAGPLPAELQHATRYEAAPMPQAANPLGARAFLRTLSGPQARAAFAACGVMVEEC